MREFCVCPPSPAVEFHRGPGRAVIGGAVRGRAHLGAVQHHLAVGREHHHALRALERSLHAVPSLAHVVAAVHHVVVDALVLAVHGNHARAQQASAERRERHALCGTDRRRVPLGACIDIGIDGAVVVANRGHQRAARNAHDIERNSLLDAARHELPHGHLRGDVVGHEYAVAARDPRLLVVERVNLERTRPVDGVARNPVRAICVDVDAVAVVLPVNPRLAAIRGRVDAVAVVVALLTLRVLREVTPRVLAERRDHDVLRVLRVDGNATVRTIVLLVGGGALLVRHRIARGDIFPRAARDVVLVDRTAADIVRARTVGVGNVHVATHNLRAVGHQIRGATRYGLPSGATVVTHLQVVLRFGDADIDCLGRAVGVLALRLVEHHEADAVHTVQARFLRVGKRDLVGARPRLAVVGTLVEALRAAPAEDNVRLVRVHRELFAGLAAHAVAVGEHFHVARVPSGTVVLAPEHGSPALAKVARPAEHVDALRVGRVERERLGAVQALVVLRDPVHQRDPPLVLEIEAVDAAHVGSRIEHIFGLRVEDHRRHEAAAIEADIAPVVVFGLRKARTRRDQRGTQHQFFEHILTKHKGTTPPYTGYENILLGSGAPRNAARAPQKRLCKHNKAKIAPNFQNPFTKRPFLLNLEHSRE